MGQDLYDTIIVGGGPAGAAAAVYGARKKLKTLFITEGFGGQSIVSSQIENWIGEVSISGPELAEKLKKHLQAQIGEILVDHKTARTSRRGIFAAGDVTNDPFKQNNISAGDGVRAALSAYSYILDIQQYSPCTECEAEE